MASQLQLEVAFFTWHHGAGRGVMIRFPTLYAIKIVV
jgi:hypothetical protein